MHRLRNKKGTVRDTTTANILFYLHCKSKSQTIKCRVAK